MNTSEDQPIAQIELVIRADTLVPEEVTATLGLPPTRSFAKGDAFPNRNEKVKRRGKRPFGLWALEVEGTDVQDIAEQLLEALRGKEAAVAQVAAREGVTVVISVWWEPPGGQGGFTVSSATLAQLCALSSLINVYFPG